jgi:hypothetical protein
MRTPPVRAPLASAWVMSAGLALPSPGSHTAPTRSSVRMMGYLAGLLGRQRLAVDALRVGHGGRAAQQHHALLGARHGERAALLPAGGQPVSASSLE